MHFKINTIYLLIYGIVQSTNDVAATHNLQKIKPEREKLQLTLL